MTTDQQVLVLGAGSIGRRHARNLAVAGATVALADPVASGNLADDPAGVRRIPWADADPGDYAGVVVASPTVHHMEQAMAAASSGASVLVEKPLATDVERARALLGANDRVRVGFNLRFHAPVRRLVDLVHRGRVGRVVAARLWFGYHLPSWRPGTDYRLSYSARAELGGGILLDAIHELDMAVWLLGPDLTVDGARVARLGDLDLDVEDTVRAQLRTPDGAPVEIALDYLSRDYRRGIEVVGTDGTARLDWARGVLELDDGARVTTAPGSDTVDRSYEAEAEAFLGWIAGSDDLPVDVETALVSLRLADEIPGVLLVSTLVVIQARMGSTRLPGKVLANLGDHSLLGLQIERLRRLSGVEIVVATSELTQDDAVVALAADHGVLSVRGPEDDVLARFALALDDHPADEVVRLTADCPLTDRDLVRAVVNLRRTAGADYAGNTLVRTFPDGLDVEVMTAATLRTMHAEATDPLDREHVTRFVLRRPDRFRLANLRAPLALAAERWTVDTPADLERVRTIVGDLDDPVTASWEQILAVAGATTRPGEDTVQPAVVADLTIDSSFQEA